MTGHAHHFLSRLDRVERPHVELALSLYNDAPLLAYVLQQVRLPEAATRVAISMDDAKKGPFLIVTRAGAFVTCLGAGMSPVDLPVVTRGQLDAIAGKAADLRERIELAQKLRPGKGAADRLFARIRRAGPWLGRDEFRAISSLTPMLDKQLLVWFVDAYRDLGELRKSLMQHKIVDLAGKPRALEEECLETYYRQVFSLGHLGMLTFLEGPRLFDAMPPELAEQIAPIVSWPLVRQGILGLSLRGMWIAAKVGRACLTAFRRRMREATSVLSALDCTSALTAIALRHERLASEARKGLVVPTFPDHFPAASRELAATMIAVCEGVLDGHEEVLETYEGAGRDFAMAITRALPEGSPHRYEENAAVPLDVALALPCNSTEACISGKDAMGMYMALPFVARARAEELYLPDDFVRATRVPWRPEQTLELLRRYRDHYGKSEPQRVEKTPGRNDPCTCGSGKKWKRCCGG